MGKLTKIEKHVPKIVKEEYKNKYKYIYHDKNNKEYDICIVEWNSTKKKSVGHKKTETFILSHDTISSDDIVSEGNTSRRIKYSNDDIAEYGSHPSQGKIWRLYIAGNETIELVKMPKSMDVNKAELIIKYSFSNSKRRYTSPGHLAAFIGALAENDFSVITTGSCFKYGSAFPSYDHSNGKSIDTKYLNDTDEQKFINGMHKFKFSKHLIGPSKKKFNHVTRDKESNGTLHDSHLHSSFDESTIITIKE